jgi:hypothetical protein
MLTGYHTVQDRENPDFIETEGPFLCARENAWLGEGYYFWDSDIDWAHEWGLFNKNRWKKGYVICEGTINNDPLLLWDIFGNVLHKKELEYAQKLIAESGYHENPEQILVHEIIGYLKKKGTFAYKGIRAAHLPKKTTKIIPFVKATEKKPKPEHMTVGERVQICVIEKTELLLRDFKIIYPEKYTLQ